MSHAGPGRGGRDRIHLSRRARILTLGLTALALAGAAAVPALGAAADHRQPTTGPAAGPAVPAAARPAPGSSAGSAAPAPGRATARAAEPAPLPAPRQAPPAWLPLRRDLNGSPIKVGCTYESYGSAFGYSCGGHHSRWALDLLATTGTPVYAAGAGYATNGTGRSGGSGFGNVVRVDHGGGIVSIYGHLSEVLVPPQGAWVTQDTLIGKVGSTGSSSAPHLHFEVRNEVLHEAIDPGPLAACWLGVRISYPRAAGKVTWKGLQWGEISVTSSGTHCPLPQAKPAAPPRSVGGPSAERSARDVWLAVAAAREQLLADLRRLVA